MLTNITDDEILTIKDAKVVILKMDYASTNNTSQNEITSEVTKLTPQAESRNYIANLYKLNEEQRRAFLIITEHLDNEQFSVTGLFIYLF